MKTRTLIIIGVVVIVVLGLTGFGVAYAIGQSNQPPAQNVSVSTPPLATPAATGRVPNNTARTVLGAIQSLNNQAFVIALLRGKATFTITTSASTKYVTLDGPATASNLKVGEAVQVTGRLDPQSQTLNATRIVILPPLGRVTHINGQTLTLASGAGNLVTVTITASTITYVPLATRSIPVSSKAIEVGQVLGYEGTSASNGAVSATKLWLLGLPQVRGTITSLSASLLTIQRPNGMTVTLNLGPNTTYIERSQVLASTTPTPSTIQSLHTGATVNVIADKNPAKTTATAVLVIIA